MSKKRARIRVINPNSNEAVTRNLDVALEPLRFDEGPEIVCTTLAEGPFGIETQADVESVVMPLRRLVEADNASDAFVIACYSDPGLHVCREGTARPVFGIAECGVLSALARAARFGVIAIGQGSIAWPVSGHWECRWPKAPAEIKRCDGWSRSDLSSRMMTAPKRS